MTGAGTKDYILPGKISNVKVILNGGQRVTFLRPDGYFSLYPFDLQHNSHFCLICMMNVFGIVNPI